MYRVRQRGCQLRNRQQVAPYSYIYMKQSFIGFRLAVVSYDVTPACRVTYPATGQGPVQHRGDRHAHRPSTTFNIWEAKYPSVPRAVYNIKNVNILRTNLVNIHRYAVASNGQYIHSAMHNTFTVLATCFGPFHWPSSGSKYYT